MTRRRSNELTLAGLDGDTVHPTASEIQDLAARIEGRVLRESDAGWDDAVSVWNAMVTKVPALVVQPTSAEDVASVVRFAARKRILIGIKGGGHNIAGTSIAHGGLQLDMSQMRVVSIDSAAKLAHVGAGCRLGDVDRATQEHGLATTLGFVSTTGVAGLTLGGGFGYLMRRFGWAADNLEQVEVVTADGRIRITDRAQDPDLFWALRGGGGNFGVVTRFTFRLHDVGPTVTGGLIIWSAEHADQVLEAYHRLTDTAPLELTVAAMIRLAPPAPFVPLEWHHQPVVGVLVCHSGADPEKDLAPLRALPEPIVDLIEEHPYAVQQSMLDELDPPGRNQYWKTEFLPGLSAPFLASFRDAALAVASPMSYSVIFHIGGAHNARAADEGAVGNRDATFVTGFSGVWPPGEDGDSIVSAVRDGWDRIQPFSTGGNYVNFQLDEDGSERTAAAYGKNLERLRRIKAAYDPHNFFRVNRNISPAKSEGRRPRTDAEHGRS
ncbi:MAG: FAD-binding oxidoreductase [Myxococcota bacterium]|nr:FAD-binding oxidoreductase [Myxococcota bacterium]